MKEKNFGGAPGTFFEAVAACEAGERLLGLISVEKLFFGKIERIVLGDPRGMAKERIAVVSMMRQSESERGGSLGGIQKICRRYTGDI